MTKFPVLLVLLLVAGIVLSGCWSSHELTRWGFVQAAAIDLSKNGQLQLTAQIYRAGSSKGGGGGGGGGSPAQQTKSGPSFINIQASSPTVHGATRDATLQLGRRLQWSHMRILLLGEDIARSQNIPQILDYFTRNNEPRGTVSLLITEGEAQQYLNLHPLIEGTIGQQLKTIEQNSFRYSGKTMEVSLTDVGIQAADDTPVYTLPFASIDKKKNIITVAGLAILKFPDGKMTGRIPAAQTPFLLMINNQFDGGSLEVPCPAGKPGYDSLRLLKARSKVKPIIQGESVQLHIRTDVEGGIAELACSEIVSDEDFKAFSQHLSEVIETRIRETVRHLQQERADLIGIGNKLSRTSPKLWADWRQSWPDKFAAMDVQIQVNLKITNTGIQVSVPFSQGE